MRGHCRPDSVTPRVTIGYDSGIQIFVRSAGESHGLAARWDVARFTDDGVAEFIGLVCTKMNSIVGAG